MKKIKAHKEGRIPGSCVRLQRKELPCCPCPSARQPVPRLCPPSLSPGCRPHPGVHGVLPLNRKGFWSCSHPLPTSVLGSGLGAADTEVTGSLRAPKHPGPRGGLQFTWSAVAQARGLPTCGFPADPSPQHPATPVLGSASTDYYSLLFTDSLSAFEKDNGRGSS